MYVTVDHCCACRTFRADSCGSFFFPHSLLFSLLMPWWKKPSWTCLHKHWSNWSVSDRRRQFTSSLWDGFFPSDFLCPFECVLITSELYRPLLYSNQFSVSHTIASSLVISSRQASRGLSFVQNPNGGKQIHTIQKIEKDESRRALWLKNNS